MTKVVDLNALVGLEEFLKDTEPRARKAMSLAMNDVLDGSGLARYRKGVTDQIDLPPGYVNDDRFGIGRKATPSDLVATINARQRPTSLARFASGGVIGGKGGVNVKVKKGGASKTIKGGFLVRLKAGKAALDDNFNVGLAVRLKPGQTVSNKKDTSRMVHLEANVVLLYGPSIDQVLRNSVIDQETPTVVSEITTEFYRQFARLGE